MKGRIPVAVAAAALLAGAATAWADLTPEGAPYSTGSRPYAVYAADFNGDGRPDVATLNGDEDPGSTSVYLRQPSGGFAAEAGSPFAAATSTGAVGDFNGDGRPDLAFADYTFGRGVAVLLRNPTGGFTREASPQLGGQLSALGTGDFNGDGRADLAVVNYSTGGNVSILLRNAANTGFDLQQNYSAGNLPRRVAIADVNGDGRLDIAVVNQGGGNVMVLLGTGGGAFTQEGAVAVGTSPTGIIAADLNRDGRADLAVTNYGDGTVSVLLRNAANTGFAQDPGSPFAVSGGPSQIATGDFDRDGTPDLALAADSGAVDILRRVPGGFAREVTPLTGSPTGIAVADFNADTVPDVAVSLLSALQLRILLSPSPPSPPPPPVTPTPTPELPPPARGQVNVIPAKGTVKIKRKGAKSFTTLTKGEQIPVGAELDTRKGTVTIIGPNAGDKASFYAGIFKISQSKGLTTLTLSQKLAPCKGRKTAKSAAAKRKPKSRKLWGDGKGRFRTNGQYGAATVRGTKWLLTDTCNYTRVKVTQGSVSFRDKVKRKTVIVRKAKLYTARKKGR